MTRLPSGEAFEIGEITVWRRGEALAFTRRMASFGPDQVTRIEVTFEPVGEETRVTVRHLGWTEIPQEHAARHGFPDRSPSCAPQTGGGARWGPSPLVFRTAPDLARVCIYHANLERYQQGDPK